MQLVMRFGLILATLSRIWPSWGFLITSQGLGLGQGIVTPSVVAKIPNILSREMSSAMIFAAGGQGRVEVDRLAKLTARVTGPGDTG